MERSVLAVLLPVAFCGGFMRGFTGFGGPLLVLPVMAIFQPAATAAASVLCMDIFANVQMLPSARAHWSGRVLLPMGVGTLIGLPIGTHALVSLDPLLMRHAISLVVLLGAAALMLGWRYSRPIHASGYGVIGLISATPALCARFVRFGVWLIIPCAWWWESPGPAAPFTGGGCSRNSAVCLKSMKV